MVRHRRVPDLGHISQEGGCAGVQLRRVWTQGPVFNLLQAAAIAGRHVLRVVVHEEPALAAQLRMLRIHGLPEQEVVVSGALGWQRGGCMEHRQQQFVQLEAGHISAAAVVNGCPPGFGERVEHPLGDL